MRVPVEVEVDHALYLKERSYRRRTLIALRRLAHSGRKRVAALSVVHEADGACCEFEDWSQTAARIYGSLAADGVGVVHAVLDHEEE